MEDSSPKTPPGAPTDKAAKSNGEMDTFEDAPEMAPRARTQSSVTTRSLTDRRPSSQSTSSKDRKPLDADAVPATPPRPNVDASKTTGHSGEESAVKKAARKLDGAIAEGMDDVNLLDDSNRSGPPPLPKRTSVSSTTDSKEPPQILSRTTSYGSQSHMVLSPSLMSPTEKPHLASSLSDKAANAANMVSGRFKSPFSWLSRSQAGPEKKIGAVTSPIPERARSENGPKFDQTSSDTSSIDRNSQTSLKDRFKAVRMREEAGIIAIGDDVTNEAPSSPTPDERRDSAGATRRLSTSTVGSIQPPTINPNLAPGMAAGIAEGPRDAAAHPVDWDLWQALVSEGPPAMSKSSPAELNRAISAGIPQAIRGVIWQVLANSKNEEMERFYHELVARGTEKERIAIGHAETNGNGKDKESIASSASSVTSEKVLQVTMTGTVESPASDGFTNPLTPKPKSAKEEVAHIQSLEKTIKRDLGARTSYSKYIMSSGLQDGLFGLCKAYALYDEEVGYAQGMNFIAMPLLFNMREEEAFCLFVKLMSKYGLRELFTQDMPGLHLHLYQFERLLEDFEPAVYCHLNRRGVSPNLYATQWFLTLFAYRFPLQLVQRIYDLILSDSLEVSILKFAIVLMQKNRDAILAMRDMSQISHFLKDKLFDVYIDKSPSSNSILESGFFGSTSGIDKEVYRADELVQDACAVPITKDMLKPYTIEWEEKQRVERDRELELESLRSQSSSLAVKVRRLEERVQKADQEHVQVASELVRTKIENGELQDENESLKGQVEELKQVVARQTEEVENRMRSEMDEVMKRNSEVHNSNRALEEEKSEMERLLVESKMMHAQINSEHETLKQRWNNVWQMMNGK